jgi:hypothetical protein
LIEQRTLRDKELDRLSDVLYNYSYRRRTNIDIVKMCFFPRNAIVFLDKAGKVKEYILLCFHCSEHATSSQKVRWGDNCDGKMDMLAQLFQRAGVAFGTDKSVTEFPGETSDEIQVPKDLP